MLVLRVYTSKLWRTFIKLYWELFTVNWYSSSKKYTHTELCRKCTKCFIVRDSCSMLWQCPSFGLTCFFWRGTIFPNFGCRDGKVTRVQSSPTNLLRVWFRHVEVDFFGWFSSLSWSIWLSTLRRNQCCQILILPAFNVDQQNRETSWV